MENLVRYRYRWFILSALLILPGLYFLLLHPLVSSGQLQLGLRLGIDFSGGALWEIQFERSEGIDITTRSIAAAFEEGGFESVQVQLSEDPESPTVSALVRTTPLSPTDPNADQERVLDALSTQFDTSLELLRLESVGPTVSQESTRSAVIAVFGASLAILIYLTWAFREAPHPLRYGMCAIISMVHDIFLMMGFAAIGGTFFNLEVDALFLTAMLTILSFSVHDTIVVFDRVRENLLHRQPDETFDDIVNHSLVQTLPRSLNTQLTTMFTLTALLLFGGATIFDFVLVLLVGLISGTYSSIFNAAQILVVWENREWESWFNRGQSKEQPSAVSR